MSAARVAAVVLVALAAGIAAGVSLAPQPVASEAPAAAPIEAPVQATKQARLDRCLRQTWPYISGDCLERVAANPRARTVEPSVTLAFADTANRTTELMRIPAVKTASR